MENDQSIHSLVEAHRKSDYSRFIQELAKAPQSFCNVLTHNPVKDEPVVAEPNKILPFQRRGLTRLILTPLQQCLNEALAKQPSSGTGAIPTFTQNSNPGEGDEELELYKALYLLKVAEAQH